MLNAVRKILHAANRDKDALFLTNTLTKRKELFAPRKKEVSLYTCGPTVYGRSHIGNLRAYVFADILHRVLKVKGYKLKHVINITDVGHLESDADEGRDKVEQAAQQAHSTAQAITKKYTDLFFADLQRLNIHTDEYIFPRATNYIAEQIEFIRSLEAKGHTYTIDDGVYFDTSTFPTYGALGNLDTAKLKEGARVESNPQKRNPSDFALWKFSTTKRLQEWDSPWGVGFPGWHIECSAMARATLGEHIDIHTGGEDHIHTHHNNEIAQSESLFKKPFVSLWLHNAFLTVDNEKISKSQGNGISLSEIEVKNIEPLALRYLFLEAHYRSPLSFSFASLKAAQHALKRLRTHAQVRGGSVSTAYQKRFLSAVSDDLNTPRALAVAWKLVKDPKVSPQDTSATLRDFDRVLGLKLNTREHRSVPHAIQKLLKKRDTLRYQKDYTGADSIRKEIEKQGYLVHDTAIGSTVEKK